MSLYHKNSALFVRNIELNVKDLPKMVDFYTRVLQFNILKETDSEVHFSSDGTHTLLSLYQSDAPATNRNTSLYHVAYLYPSKYALSKALKHIALSKYPITGGADHTVSDAIYLDDPEGNGIELYVDTNPTAWADIEAHPERLENLPFPYQSYLDDTYKADGSETDPLVGHLHMHTSNLTQATNFYQDVLGFDIVVSIPSANFISTAGYHHHIALNTWRQMRGVKNGLGLREIILDTEDSDLKKRLIEHIKQTIEFTLLEDSILFEDFDHNVIAISTP